jgi:mono/diheme cytochrome c family protein
MKLFLLVTLAAAAAAPHSVWEGVYSAEQAGRGKKAYLADCTRCHGDMLAGVDDSPALVGQAFLKKWNGKSVARLVDLTRRTMPTDGPGDLSREECTDITAYLLQVNGFPAGKDDLASDAAILKQIMIEPKK